MVLEEVGSRIRRAVEQMRNATIIDDKVFNDCLNEITRALLLSDVQFKLVHDMITNMKKYLNTLSVAHYRNFTTIQHSIFVELCKILYIGNQSFTPMKGEPSVVMFVGLQGSGKTTTCIKYARYHKMRGWKPALVCAADTFSSHQLKLNATEANIPFHGSSDDVGSDPVKVAVEGVKMFQKQNRDLIIVDTSIRAAGDNQQVEKLRKLYMKIKPDLLVFVMDSSVGQEAALHQAQAFRRNTLYAVRAVVLTKLDAHAKGAGALSAVAAAGSPVIFIGTGEHMDDFQAFVGRPFVGRLLGTGDLYQVVQRKTHPGETFTFRIMYEQFQNILKIAPIDQVVSSMAPPGFRSELMPKGDRKIRKAKIKTYMSMMKAMTNEELDSKDPEYFIDEVKMMRIARGVGRELSEVIDMFEEYKRLARVWSKLKSYENFIDEDGKMYIRSCRGWPLTKTEWVLVGAESP